MSQALRGSPKSDDRLASSSAGGVFRGSKRTCADRARWRLVRGQAPQRLSPHYQLECDFGMSILAIYNEGDPVFLCENHVSAITPKDNCFAGVRPVEAAAKLAVETDPAAIVRPGRSASSAAELPNATSESFQSVPAVENPGAVADQEPVESPEIARAIPSTVQPVEASRSADGTEPSAPPALRPAAEASLEQTERTVSQPAAAKTRRDSAVPSKAPTRDLAYGNPAKALVDETIWNMVPGDLEAYRKALGQGRTPLEAAQAAGGQLAVIYRKIGDYTAKIEAILSASKATISIGYAIDKPLEQATLEIIGSNAMGEAEKDAAVEHLGALQKQIKSGLEAAISPLQAHRIAREIGERTNWGGNSNMPQEVKQTSRAVYARLRDALRAFVPEARELDERLTNLYAAKSDIEGAAAPKAAHSAAV